MIAPMLRGAVVAGAAILFAVASGASAAPRRAPAEGPIIMSGTMVPPVMARRSRAAQVCKPVTIKRAMYSTLLKP